MHISIIADSIDNQNAGVHYYTKNLIKALQKIDQKSKYSFIHNKNNDFFENTENYVIKSNEIIPFHETYRKFYKLPKLIKKLNPDIVLETAHMGPFNLPDTIKKAVIIYDLTPLLFPQFHTKHASVGHKLLLGKVIKNADLLLCISENTKKDLIEMYKPNAKIKVIHAGIKKPQENPPHPDIEKPYILYLGTLEPRKNIPLLIDAFKELKKEHKIPHKLVLAGAIGWKAKEIKEKSKHKDIILTGYIDDEKKTSLLKHADIFVYPSIYEGFGLPPLEAMSYSTPVITSTGGSLKEIFENQTLTFDPKDKEKLKKHIMTLINNPELKEKLAKDGKEYSKTFTWENTAQKTLNAFVEILNNQQQPSSS